MFSNTEISTSADIRRLKQSRNAVKTPPRLIKNLKLLRQNFAQNQHDRKEKKSWAYRWRKLVFEWSVFHKYGLYTHDVIDYDHPVIREALRRLPEDVLDARNFRIIRALQLDFLKTHLPREKWVTYEQDLEYRYLGPYIKEIETERAEIYNFGCRNYDDDDWPADDVK